MNIKLQVSMVGIIFVILLLPSAGSGDVSVPWISKDHHAHADASIWRDSPPYSDSASEDTYSPPLLLPINASASVYEVGPPYLTSNAESTITASDILVMISVFDQSEGWADGSASNDIVGSYFATAPVFEFSYSYDYDISVTCDNYPLNYFADNYIEATLKVTDKTDSIILFDETIISATISCNSQVNPGTFSDIDAGSGVITVPVIVGHEIEVEFWNSGDVNVSGSTASGDTDFTLLYDVSEAISAYTPVPWNSEDYHTHSDTYYLYDWWTIGGGSGSDSDSDDAYSPPLPLPVSTSAYVSKSPPGPQWGNADSTIAASDMEFTVSVDDSANRDNAPGDFTSETYASAADEFNGAFIASHDLFLFSYSYDYSIDADCNYLGYPYSAYNSVQARLKITDLTSSSVIIDETFLNVSRNCNGDLYNITDIGSDVISVPVTVGHDIWVEFGIDGDSSASGNPATAESALTLQYDTAMRCVDPPLINDRTAEYYLSHQDACSDPDTINNDTIKSQAVVISGDWEFNENILVILEAGYNCDYSAVIGKSTLNGNVTISDGKVIMQSGVLEVL